LLNKKPLLIGTLYECHKQSEEGTDGGKEGRIETEREMNTKVLGNGHSK